MTIQTLFSKVRSRIGTSYIALFYYRVPELRGIFNLIIYNLLYANFDVGKNARVWGRFYAVMYEPHRASIKICDNLWMVSEEKRAGITFFCRCKLTTIGSGQIKIGDNVALNGSVITSKKCIEIGDNTMLAPNVIIVDSDFHIIWPPENRFKQVGDDLDEAVIIGRNVWIGMNSIILKGASIGDNSVIGAGSVVNSAIPANCIAAGNPARIVKTFDEFYAEEQLHAAK